MNSTNSNVRIGTSANLVWTGSDVDTAILAPWDTPAPITGSRLISPTADTPYSLAVSNSVGTGSCNTFVSTYANSIPVANSDTISITGSSLNSIAVLANDTDSDSGDILTINSITTIPVHGVASISGDNIMYTANSGYCGTDTISYKISDNYDGISVPANISITVNCIPDVTAPVITLVGSGNMDIFLGSVFMDPGASCTDNVDLSCTVTSSGTPDTNTLGTYVITYSASDIAGNTGTLTRNVNVIVMVDITAPVITLSGSSNIDITQGSGFIDPGASCTDNIDLSCTVTSSGTPDTNTLGTYLITYSASDIAGNTGTLTRNVNVIAPNTPDTTPPIIILVGTGNMDISLGNGFIDPGASCTDNVNLSCTVTSSGTPDTNTIGTYVITYSASDIAGNTGTLTRNVNVITSGS